MQRVQDSLGVQAGWVAGLAVASADVADCVVNLIGS